MAENKPNGRYIGKAVEWDVGEANTGTRQICVVGEITEGDFKGRQYTWYGFFNDEPNAERAFKALTCMGWNGQDMVNWTGLGSKEAQFVITQEVDPKGVERTKIAFVNDRDSDGIAMKKRYSPQEKTVFAQEMKGYLMAFQKKAGVGAAATAANGTKPVGNRPPQPQADQAQHDDSDPIPF